MDDWSAYRSFLGVLRTGSLSAAARSLGLSQPTLGRHIAALEAELGTALFTRSVRGLAPTDSALAIRPHAEAIEAATEAARRASSAPADSASGVVRITTSEIVGAEVLPPMLAALRERHRGLAFELSLSNRTEDLMRRDADIAVRMVKSTQSALVTAYVGKVTIGLFGRRDYLARHGTPAKLSDLPGHTLIGFDRETPFLTAAKRQLKLEREMFALRCDSDLANLAALRAGCGLSICQVPLARRSPDLVRLFKEEVAFTLEIWVAMHEDLKRVRRMRVAFDHLVASMKAYARA
jgi:DNA-binding transcriptional LysR family regulator